MIQRILVKPDNRVFINRAYGFLAACSKKDKRALGLNGCGPKVVGWPVPELAFHEACNLHDLLYSMGGSWRDRWCADAAFLDLMLLNLKLRRRPLWKRLWLRGAAHAYFWAVRALGAGAFNHGPRMTVQELSHKLSRQRGIGR